MEDTLRYKFDKDLLLNYDHDNPPRHGSCCYAEFVEARDYDKLREQNRVLREALQQAKYELAALFPVPSDPTVLAALKVCGNNNEADARCIYMAYEIVRAALTATSQEGQQ